MAQTRGQRWSLTAANGETVNINLRYKYKMSDSGDPDKIEKKREYNRNAQRVFRQRRKEHLKHLEAAERSRSTAQTEELERLRREIDELRQENESLRMHGSQSGSPYPPSLGSTSGHLQDATLSSPPQTHASSFPFTSPPPGAATLGPAEPSAQPRPPTTPELCILVSHNMSQVRTYLHSLFQPILDCTDTSPQQHLSLLASLSPSLPSQLRPTDLQLSTPHHLYIDLLPSPSLRNRLITAGPTTANVFLQQVCTFASDSLENRGQLTIWGEDVLNEFSWEFSAEILEQWGGWLLPREWGERANFWRVQRGAPVLPAWV
ncbi:hypothetical protein FQN54_001983 [Arachnomyces sp. PD_36]|nr:hypothetical protein FQN54_001983 [Arachnomyces sp. PD_36]